MAWVIVVVPVTIQLFGRFQVSRDDIPVDLPTRPTESVCAYLAARLGKPVTRKDLALVIWPEVDAHRAANRLRTGLVHIRQLLQPWASLQTDRETVALDTADCLSDLLEAERLYRRCRIANDPAEGQKVLSRLLAIIGNDFLQGWRDGWTEPMRNFWRRRRIEAALSLAGLAAAEDNHPLVESEALRALESDELNEEAWATYLRVLVELERSSEGIERFRLSRQRRIAESGLDFSGELRDLARRIASGKLQPQGHSSRSSGEARELMGKALDRELAANPELMLPLLASEGFRKEAMQNPLEAWKILRQVMESTDGDGQLRLKAMALTALLAAMVDEYGAAFDYCEAILELAPEHMQVHQTAVNMLGFFSFELREWEDAWRYVIRYRDLTSRYGSEGDAAIARSQLATLMWQQGRYTEARDTYLTELKVLEANESVSGLHNVASLLLNLGFIATLTGEWEEAKRILSKAHALAVANNFHYLRGFTMAPLGLAKMVTGEVQEGKRLASLGLAYTFRSRYVRVHQIAADYAAGAVAVVGQHSTAMVLLTEYTTFRNRSQHTRSLAEDQLAATIAGWCGCAWPADDVTAGHSRSELVAMACDVLES